MPTTAAPTGRLADLTGELQAHLKNAQDLATKAEAEGRDFTDAERSQVGELLAKAKDIRGRLEAAKADQQMRSAIAELGDGIGLIESSTGTTSDSSSRAGAPGYVDLATPRTGRRGVKSVGQVFCESPEFQGFLGQFPGGEIPSKARVQSLPVAYKSLFSRPFAKNLVTGADDRSAGAFVVPDDTGIFDPLGRPELTVRGLLSVRQTGSDTVEWVRQTSRVQAAAPVAEATETQGDSGRKPEGGFRFERVSSPVRTIAEWIPATRRALSDVAQLRGLIDDELRGDLAQTEEDQLLNGNGQGENLTGILNTEGIQVQPFDTDEFDTARKAKTRVRLVGRGTANAYLMNPEDWERLDLKRDRDGRYFGAGPWGVTTPTLWGLPVVESEYLPVGTALVGDWRRAVLWDREQATISVTDSHADFFIRNLVAVLAEERIAFGVIRPAAFVQFDLTGGNAGGGTRARR